jgi:hypothetical protein
MFRVKDEKEKKDKKPKTKQQKWAIGLGIALAALFVLTIGAKLMTLPQSPIYYDYLLMLMPESKETEFDGKKITLYIEKNKDYNKEQDDVTNAFSVYYYENGDKSKDKIYLSNGKELTGVNESSNYMSLSFMVDATLNYNLVQKIIKRTFITLCVLTGFYLIFIWYIIWSIRYDKKKELNKG